MLGLTVLPRLDAAGALCIPLLLAFLWRSRARAAYAGVFLVVAALELYGTAIGTWRWAEELPGLGIPQGNPPSGVAAGYVWFDVMALLVRAVPPHRRPADVAVTAPSCAWHRPGLEVGPDELVAECKGAPVIIRRRSRRRTQCIKAVAGQACDRQVGGCELRPLTILLGLRLGAKSRSGLPRQGESEAPE